MKTKIYTALLAALVCLVSCNDQLDITPKGQTILQKTSELELLLNNQMGLGSNHNLCIVCNECYPRNNVKSVLSKTNSLEYAFLTFDESVDRAALTPKDEIYSNAYSNIYYTNIILERADASEGGSEALKTQIKAEAHLLRAYEHYLLANIYARQYDEATAATTPGVPYVETTDVTTTKEKNTLAEDYEKMLADCADEYIAALPDQAKEMRGSKAWGNAVRAKILYQMKHYSDALPYALKTLEYNGTIEDRRHVVDDGTWQVEELAPSNIMYMPDFMGLPFDETVTLETLEKVEDGDIQFNYASDYGDLIWDEYYGKRLSGVEGSRNCSCFDLYWNNWGVTSDRMYYVAAECYIRTGQIQKGMDLINKVRQYRIAPDTYQPLTASTEQEAMDILQRCKWIENLATYDNFFDSKRWNSEAAYSKTITRTMPVDDETKTYSIAPDSKLWVFPFPANAVRNNKKLTQNYDE